MKKVGIIGWRGMVGSVLLQRMLQEGDFNGMDVTFFSTSNFGGKGPVINAHQHTLADANSVEQLTAMDIIISCQGGEYTKRMHPKLREHWSGFWIDAASALRMQEDSVIILDPINEELILRSLESGVRDFVGGNCTVSLMLMAVGGLFKENLVDWMTSMTYQAASGGGAKHMKELLGQMKILGDRASSMMSADISKLDATMTEQLRSADLPCENFKVPLALNLIPWIDSALDNGQSREEWKACAEANKILGNKTIVPIDGTCVRVGAMRSHSQALTIKLKRSVDLKTVEQLIKNTSAWTEFVENDPEQTRNKLCPRYVSGTLKTTVGRVRPMNIGEEYLNVFTCGDQLLWGAAEPLRRMAKLLLK